MRGLNHMRLTSVAVRDGEDATTIKVLGEVANIFRFTASECIDALIVISYNE